VKNKFFTCLLILAPLLIIFGTLYLDIIYYEKQDHYVWRDNAAAGNS
jgi:hypothetical protein